MVGGGPPPSLLPGSVGWLGHDRILLESSRTSTGVLSDCPRSSCRPRLSCPKNPPREAIAEFYGIDTEGASVEEAVLCSSRDGEHAEESFRKSWSAISKSFWRALASRSTCRPSGYSWQPSSNPFTGSKCTRQAALDWCGPKLVKCQLSCQRQKEQPEVRCDEQGAASIEDRSLMQTSTLGLSHFTKCCGKPNIAAVCHAAARFQVSHRISSKMPMILPMR